MEGKHSHENRQPKRVPSLHDGVVWTHEKNSGKCAGNRTVVDREASLSRCLEKKKMEAKYGDRWTRTPFCPLVVALTGVQVSTIHKCVEQV